MDSPVYEHLCLLWFLPDRLSNWQSDGQTLKAGYFVTLAVGSN